MQATYVVPRARLGPLIAALIIALLGVPAPAAAAAETPDIASAGWHGRAIQDPKTRPEIPGTSWPAGWSAGSVGPGTGFVKPGGSDRVRDVQRRLVQLGYRPGPVDGLFGPRTRASVRWFQYKHGLATHGRVNRGTLAVLHARSDHEPLRRPRSAETAPERPAATSPPTLPSPAPAAAPPAPEEDDDSIVLAVSVLLLLAALAAGLVTGLRGPKFLRALDTEQEPTPVLGYAHDREAAEAIARRCADGEWELVGVTRDLDRALRGLRDGAANGLVVARLEDVAPGIAGLAALVHRLEEAHAFLAAADHDLDTSTEEGRATARAIAELGAWERRNGRFTPRRPDLAEEIVAMLEQGIPPRAVTDALMLAGFEKERRT
jgi:peptidoglycan hydrolase-like protein with peptidoglycan-binding domain